MTHRPPTPDHGRWTGLVRAYAELLRIPNIFTAMADISLGWLAAAWTRAGESTAQGWINAQLSQDMAGPEPVFWLLLGSSSCLYSAGMVWNDYFDLEEDRRERPLRPIPSGRVSLRTARCLGLTLLGLGIGLAAGSWPRLGGQPFMLAFALVLCVLLYDAWLKRTLAGPLGMGLCRFLNVLLGMSASAAWPEPWMLQVAAVVGLYVVGVTLFARTETRESQRGMLLAAAAIMIMALGTAATLPTWWSPTSRWEVFLYPYLLAVWAVVVGLPAAKALRRPRAQLVQTAVKYLVLGLVGLDALLAFVVVGWPGLTLLVLLAPALALGRWVYST